MTKKEFYELAECNDGWLSLLDPIYYFIKSYNSSHSEHIEVLQIKQKFGGLRIYTNFHTEELDKLIEEAEKKAYNTCEWCGSTKNVTTKPKRVSGWILTLCEKCRQQM